VLGNNLIQKAIMSKAETHIKAKGRSKRKPYLGEIQLKIFKTFNFCLSQVPIRSLGTKKKIWRNDDNSGQLLARFSSILLR
jgi:hypothetical protein